MKNLFDEKYFEDGVRHRVSAYENYRWQPERTIREASSLINNIEFDNVLDFGCAKGFMLHDIKEAIPGISIAGVDISSYAIENAMVDVKPFLKIS